MVQKLLAVKTQIKSENSRVFQYSESDSPNCYCFCDTWKIPQQAVDAIEKYPSTLTS